MAVICFSNSGSGTGRRAATAVAGELSAVGLCTALYDCLERAVAGGHRAPDRGAPMRNRVCGRQFIEDIRALRSSHEHIVIDLPRAGDQIAAIAFAIADLILVPFLPHEEDAEPFVRTIELLDILSSHRPQPLRRAVFLASRDCIGPGLHLEISGQLIRRGLTTLPVPFQERRPCLDVLVGSQATPGNEGEAAFVKSDISRFAQCALNATLHSSDLMMPRALALG